jgi:hypothetical protein
VTWLCGDGDGDCEEVVEETVESGEEEEEEKVR